MTHKSNYWLALSITLAFSPHPTRAQELELKLQNASEWLAQAIPHGTSHKKIVPVVLPMNTPSYQQFASAAYPDEMATSIGKPALSAFFQQNGLVDGKKADICYLLFNPMATDELMKQFVTNHDSKLQPNYVPYVFLAAHELGHCYDFQRKQSPAYNSFEAEVFADAFAIHILLMAKIPEYEIKYVIASRNNTSQTHSTWKKIEQILNQKSAPRNIKNIEDIINASDNVTKGN